jgi:hypothetical protein
LTIASTITPNTDYYPGITTFAALSIPPLAVGTKTGEGGCTVVSPIIYGPITQSPNPLTIPPVYDNPLPGVLGKFAWSTGTGNEEINPPIASRSFSSSFTGATVPGADDHANGVLYDPINFWCSGPTPAEQTAAWYTIDAGSVK